MLNSFFKKRGKTKKTSKKCFILRLLKLTEKNPEKVFSKDKKRITQLTDKKSELIEEISEIDQKIIAIQQSTRTNIRFLAPMHNDLRMKYKWYYDWHLKKYASRVHLALLIIMAIAILIGSYYSISAILNPVSTKATGESWTVSGAGTSAYNGIYTDNSATNEGQSVYEIAGGGKYLYYTDTVMGYKAWVLDSSIKEEMDTNYYNYYNEQDPATSPTAGTWYVGAGVASAPSVVAYSLATVPDAPTIGTATAGNGQATVAFTPPANNGGAEITSYTATSSPGSITASGSGSPITVTGLTNSTSYTFTVHATNSEGNSSESSASNSVTPSVSGITISGTIYTAENKSTNIGAGKTVALSVDGDTKSTVETTSGGAFSFSPVSVVSDDTITLFIDDETEEGNYITVTNGSSNITGIEMYSSKVVLSHETTGPITNTLLDTANNCGDDDIKYSISSSNSTFTATFDLWIKADKTYTPGGTVSAGSIKMIGDLNLGSNAASFSGDFEITDGELTSTGTITFNKSSGTQTVNVGSSSGSGWVVSGAGDSSYNGTYAESGTYNSQPAYTNGSKWLFYAYEDMPADYIWALNTTKTMCMDCYMDVPYYDGVTLPGTWYTGMMGTGPAPTVSASSGTSTSFQNLTKSGGGTLQIIDNDLDIDGTLTISSSTVLDINGNNLTAATLSNEGTLLLEGGETVDITTMDANSGTVEYDGATSYSSLAVGNGYYSLKFNNSSGSWTLDANLSVAGILDLNAGTLNASSKTITLSGSGTPFVVSGTFTEGTSTVIYTGSSATNVAATTYNNLTLNQSGTTFTSLGNTTIKGTFTITAGTYNASDDTITLSGTSTPFVNSGTFTASTSTVKYTGEGDTTIAAVDYYNLETSPTAGGSGGWVSSSAGTSAYNTTFVESGTYGSNSSPAYTDGSVWLFNDYADMDMSDVWCMHTSKFDVDMSDMECAYVSFTTTLSDSMTWYAGYGSSPLPTLTESAGTSTYTFASGTINIGGNYVNGDGTHSVTTTADINDPILNIDGNFTNSAGATFTSSASAAFSVASNFTNNSTATFTHSSGTLTLDGQGAQSVTVDGDSLNNLTITNASTGGVILSDALTVAGTFTDVTASSKITFGSGLTYAFANININGQATDTRIVLTSSGTWYFNVSQSSPSVSYVSVTNSNASGGNNIDATVGCNDGTGNTNWTFSSSSGITISGTIYTAENKSTNIGANKTVALSINGGTKSTVETTTGGLFSFGSITVATNNTISLFLDEETEKASLITQAVDSSTGITSLELFTGNIVLSHQTAGPMTNALLATADNVSDTDLLVSVDGSSVATFSNTFWVITGKTYTPGAAISSTSVNIDGTFNPGTYDVTVSGSWDANSGSVSSSGTVTFSGTTGTISIGSGGQSFNNLVLNDSAGTATYRPTTALDVNGTFTLTDGTLDLDTNDPTVNIAGNITIDGGSITKSSSNSTVTFDGDLIYNDNVGGTNFGDIQIGASPDTTNLSSNMACDSLTVSSGDVLNTNGYDIDSAGDIVIASAATLDSTDDVALDDTLIYVGGSWSNSGTFTADTSTVIFDSSSTGETIVDGGSNWNKLTFNGTGAGWSFSDATIMSGDLTITAGTLSGTNNITVNGGDATGDGTISLTGGTFLLDGAGNFGGSSNWLFSNLTFGDGSGTATTTKTSSNQITVSGILTIAANQTLNASDDTLTLSGTGTPFVNNGTFTASTSTVKYTGEGNTTIAAVDYYNLETSPTAGGYTYTFASGWYNTDWNYRQKITVDHTKVSNTDQTDFPMLVKITDAANTLFTNAKANGDDILFTSSDQTTKLSHEIETYDPTTHELWAWVKIPTLSASADTIIYIYYGNSTATNQQNATDVWSNGYDGVFHFDEASWTGQADEVENVLSYKDLTSQFGADTASSGFIDRMGDFTGDNPSNASVYSNDRSKFNYWKNGYNGSYYLIPSEFTASVWFKTSTTTETGYLLNQGTDSSGYGIYFSSSDQKVYAHVGNVSISSTNNNYKDGNWHKASLITTNTSGSNYRFAIMVDGQLQSSWTDPTSSANGSYNTRFVVGSRNWTWAGNFIDGTNAYLDEAKLSSTDRSADWVATEYANQNSPSTFCSLSSSQGYSQSANTTNIGGNYVNGDGTHSVTTTADTNDSVLSIDGNFTNSAGSTFVASASAVFSIASNFTNNSTATFTHSSGTLTLDGQGAQSITTAGDSFNNLTVTNVSTGGITFVDNSTVANTFTDITADSIVTFTGGTTHNWNTINLDGQAEGTEITLQSSDTSDWYFNITTQTQVVYVDASHSDASGGIAIRAADGTNIDSGDNTNWIFDQFTIDSLEFVNPYGLSAADDAWYDFGWSNRSKITIDHTKVDSALTNFPVLVNSTDVNWKSTTNDGKVASLIGDDILFTDSSGTKLSHEIESYDNTTGKLVAWVKMSTLSASTDTIIYIYYGNSSCASQQNVADVWSNSYVGVWHLNEEKTGTGTSDLYKDSTSNNNHGDDYVSATGQIGKINGGQEFDGVDDYILVSDSSSLDISESVTLSGWGNISSLPSSPSDVTGSGTATAHANQSGEEPVKAFDNSLNTKWCAFGQTGWIKYDFGSGNAKKIVKYKWATANDATSRDPKSWELQGSNTDVWTTEGTDYEVVDKVTGFVATNTRKTWAGSFDAYPSQAYRYYRMSILEKKSTDSYIQLSEIEMYESGTADILSKNDAYGLSIIPGSVKSTIDTGLAHENSYGISSGIHYMSSAFDGSKQKVFIDGSESISVDLSGTITTNSHNLVIGNLFDGTLDELHISSTTRSPDWISTEYANQNSPSTFYDISDTVGRNIIADDTTEWNFRVKITDQYSLTDIDYVELRLANSSDSTQPYDSIKFRWSESSDTFSEEADTQNAITLTSISTDSSSSGSQWTIDYKFKVNSNFDLVNTFYSAEVYVLNDQSTEDTQNYANFYQVSALSIAIEVDAPTIEFGNLLPGSIATDTTICTVTTNYPNGYSLSAHDSIASGDSVLLHTDATTRITDYLGTISLPTSWSGTGLGISLYSATDKETKWGTGTTESDSNNKYAGVPENATIIHEKTGSPTASNQNYIGYKLIVPNTQKTGDYSGTITYTATGVLN